MGITNDTQRIEELVGQVRDLINEREYEMAHSTLVDIEVCILSLKNHIDHLRNIANDTDRHIKEIAGGP